MWFVINPLITDYCSSSFFGQCTVQVDNCSFGRQISLYSLLTGCFCVVEIFMSSSLVLTVATFLFFRTMAVLLPVISLHSLTNNKFIRVLLSSFSFCEFGLLLLSCCASVTFLSLYSRLSEHGNFSVKAEKILVNYFYIISKKTTERNIKTCQERTEKFKGLYYLNITLVIFKDADFNLAFILFG